MFYCRKGRNSENDNEWQKHSEEEQEKHKRKVLFCLFTFPADS